jgi:hypothetical protein
MTPNVDWFVAPTQMRGDGSRERPFHDPWMAFLRAEPGDTVHIETGTYFGRFDRSSWIIECPRLTVLGGYSRDFTTRTPWKTPSVFAYFAGYESVREPNLITGREDHSDLVLDGLCFDAAGRNEYGAKEGAGISRIPNMESVIASLNAANVTIRNCVFTNSANGGVELQGSGSRFENNLLINLVGTSMLSLKSSTQLIEKPIVVTGNTFCFMHDPGDPAGGGGPQSHGVIAQCPAVIENNLFVSCANSGISNYVDPERMAIERNVFFATPRDVLESRSSGTTGEIKEKNLEELEDLGFKACAGNVVQDPAIHGLPGPWVDAWSRDLFARYRTPPRDAANALRAAAGLPPLSPADVEKPDQKGAMAPRFPLSAIATFTPGAQPGFHAVELPVAVTPRAPAPTPDYRRIAFPAIVTPEASLANARVELRVGLGAAQNTQILPDAAPDTHMGARVYNPGTDDDSFLVLIRRNSFASRQYREARNYPRGMEVEKTYFLRGVCRTDVSNSRQKATLLVESIEPAPIFAPPIPPRPEGRDWFVRAGSSGGDGSREKPFRDPFQALEKAEGGDTIHVAAGDYFGKLRSGRWVLSIRYLALLGGYDADFKTRDPWTNHTRFALEAEERAKGRPEGKILYSEENSDGLLLDGFIFDGSTWNTYKDGSLDLDRSPIAPLIQLRGLDSPVTVRNCIFLNGSDSAVDINCALTVFENNIVVNTSGDALTLNSNAAGPAVIRNNTLLFAADPTERAGTGKSSSRGAMIELRGRGAIDLESNLIAFGDNYGMRAALPQDNITLRNNVFAANLFNHLCDCQYLFADGTNWTRRVEADSSYALDGNQLSVSQWPPIDVAFLDLALARLFQLPSRIKTDEWKSIASATGATVRPVEEESASAVETPVPTPSPAPAPASSGGSLTDIMARLSGTAAKLKAAEKAAPAPAAGAPKYCPVFDYKKAMALVTEGPDSVPGAHRKTLEVSFRELEAKPQITYTPITAADVDAQRESLNGKPIELTVSQVRDSSSTPSSYAPGTDKKNYTAYGVAAVDGNTRTRLSIVIREDTDASKRMRRVQSSDKLLVRGTAYAIQGTSGLAILVDTFDVAGT